jgi:hypothetical protein
MLVGCINHYWVVTWFGGLEVKVQVPIHEMKSKLGLIFGTNSRIKIKIKKKKKSNPKPKLEP